MEDRHLQRKADNAKNDVESVIEQLIDKVEELEAERDKLNERITELEQALND